MLVFLFYFGEILYGHEKNNHLARNE